jgi:hypothetical protein
MNLHGRIRNGVIIVSLICAPLVTVGCEGTETRATVDDTVQELAGKKNTDRFQQMKSDIDNIQKQQAHNYRQLDHEPDSD